MAQPGGSGKSGNQEIWVELKTSQDVCACLNSPDPERCLEQLTGFKLPDGVKVQVVSTNRVKLTVPDAAQVPDWVQFVILPAATYQGPPVNKPSATAGSRQVTFVIGSCDPICTTGGC